jgi:CheY-like chemotaxis protein
LAAVDRKILLIEDDADLSALVKYNLEKDGYGVCGSPTGRDAVELCDAARPDLVLLDIMLPDADGFEICRQIRQNPEHDRLPIIFLTARSAETDRIVGLEIGANDYIVKPFFIWNSWRASASNSVSSRSPAVPRQRCAPQGWSWTATAARFAPAASACPSPPPNSASSSS